jgi:hypothetical protein
MNAYEWDRKDEEYISTPKWVQPSLRTTTALGWLTLSLCRFYIEVINETPIAVNNKNGEATTRNDAYEDTPSPPVVEAPVRTAVRPGGLSRGPSKPSTNTKFKSPVASNGALPPTSVAPYRPVHLAKRTASGMRKDASAAVDQFDFGRNPTSEWHYRPNAITRSRTYIMEAPHRYH